MTQMVEDVDPWVIIEKLRIQHREEIHTIWMPLVAELRSELSAAPSSASVAVSDAVAIIKDYGQDAQPGSEYRLACDDLIERFSALTTQPDTREPL